MLRKLIDESCIRNEIARLVLVVVCSLFIGHRPGCTYAVSGMRYLSGDTSDAQKPFPPRSTIIQLATESPHRGSLLVSGRRLLYIRGGTIRTAFSPKPKAVQSFVERGLGCGGINGGFFTGISQSGTVCRMIGPVMCSGNGFYCAADPYDVPRCLGRPLLLLGQHQAMIVPFEAWMGESAVALRRLFPSTRDAFLTGGWLIHNGIAVSADSIRLRCIPDAMGERRRTFLGIDRNGRLVIGATDYRVDSLHLARSLAPLGISEAVLLDGGFSTSLMWKRRILVSGDSRRYWRSRAVPHALVIR